ncbi:Golgi transport complex subunit 6 [Coemansia erecta]|uniref:Conserved oligomeric Golgi complex subunit 6 n=1 Tax=Coemansia erecta TaxID=147472 RepID=A0A9W7XZL7_9FUNG|nr:Golgi transport complex subunit 6 [Coemansia erecta]
MLHQSQSLVTSGDTRASGSLGRRVHQIVQMPLDGPEVRQALEALASCYDQKTAAPSTGSVMVADKGLNDGLAGLIQHRDVRGDMQERTIQLDVEFAQALGMVDEVFEELEESVRRIDEQCAGLRIQVNSALHATAAAAEQAALLGEEQRDLALRRKLAMSFIERFSPTAEQAQILARSPPVVDQAFLEALDSVSAVRAESLKLMGVGQLQTAVRELSQELEQIETKAYAGLLRWVIDSVRELSRDTPEFSAQLKNALKRLRSHKALFEAATSEIAQARCEALARAFINALVRGGPNGTPRPIEAHAGDPQRYVGDMLAWVHQACASEKELFDTLFVDTRNESAEDKSERARLLAIALANVARPLEIRISQTSSEIRAPVALYRIDSLLSFYSQLFNAVCPAPESESTFMDTIESLCRRTHQQLFETLDAMADSAVSDFDTVTTALEVPASLNSLLSEMAEIIRLHTDSLTISATDSSEMRAADSMTDDITALLDRVLDEAHISASAHSNTLRVYEQQLFELNVLATIHESVVVSSAGLLDKWLDSCSKREDELMQKLSSELVEVLKEKSHLPFSSATDEEGAAVPSVSASQIESFNHTLKMATDLDVSRLVSRLENHALARSVAQRATDMFIAEYALLYSRISEAGKESGDATSLLPPDTVATLM